MLTEKTLGKIELLENYLSENYPKDVVINTILNGVVADLNEQPKEVTHKPIPRPQTQQTVQRTVNRTQVSQKSSTAKSYPEKIDLSKVNKGNFQKLADKKLETKKFENSTVLNKATYDKGSKTLTAYEKHGVIVEYPNIPIALKDGLFNNGRPGKYYNVFIKKEYNSKDISLVK